MKHAESCEQHHIPRGPPPSVYGPKSTEYVTESLLRTVLFHPLEKIDNNLAGDLTKYYINKVRHPHFIQLGR